MTRSFVTAAALLAAAMQGLAQPEFEVASLRMTYCPTHGSPPAGIRGGPGTNEPTRLTIRSYLLGEVLREAFNLPKNRFDTPGWVENDCVEIGALMADGTTRDQYRAMLQKLLTDRFHIKLRLENRTAMVYNLVVDRQGPKLRSNTTGGEMEPLHTSAVVSRERGRDGFAAFPPGRTMVLMGLGGQAQMQAVNITMPQFAALLSSRLRTNFVDDTQLKGRYDFEMDFDPRFGGSPLSGLSPEPDNPYEPLPSALSKLGLGLRKSEGTVQFTIVESMDREPAPN